MQWQNITTEKFYTLIQFYQTVHIKMWLSQVIVIEKPCEPIIVGCTFYVLVTVGNDC